MTVFETLLESEIAYFEKKLVYKFRNKRLDEKLLKKLQACKLILKDYRSNANENAYLTAKCNWNF